ncbi:hypothetical protein TRVL_08480 [Trypanosoma vivax]|nr:hypothetical protein TRVL_08480 [Trypanosoma vivax]
MLKDTMLFRNGIEICTVFSLTEACLRGAQSRRHFAASTRAYELNFHGVNPAQEEAKNISIHSCCKCICHAFFREGREVCSEIYAALSASLLAWESLKVFAFCVTKRFFEKNTFRRASIPLRVREGTCVRSV